MDVYKQDVGMGEEAVIVASYEDHLLVAWTLRLDGELRKIFKVTFEDAIMPKTVRFDSQGNIYAFALNGGHMYVFCMLCVHRC